MNCPFPVSSLWSSKRLTGWPAPKRILPGRIFISLSFELLVGLGRVLAVFQRETTRAVIPGWSEGPDPESRDSGFDADASPRNDEKARLHATGKPVTRVGPGIVGGVQFCRETGTIGCGRHPRYRH